MNIVFHYDVGSELKADLHKLSTKGFHVTSVAVGETDQFQQALEECEVLWHVLEPVTQAHIKAAPKLKLIQKIGVGVNTIDVPAASEASIAVCNMPGTNTQAVAEMTLMLMLSALRRATYFHSITCAGKGWEFPADMQNLLGEISGKTVGFVGFGSVPQRLTPILLAMGARIIYNATTSKNVENAEFQTLDAVLSNSDIVSLHVPLTAETNKFIDAAAINKIKPGAILINTARGEIIEEKSLIAALKNGRLSAAGLDVFENEPIDKDNPLLQLENVSVTPHLAWLTRETLTKSITVAIANCERLRDGKELLHCVNKQ